MSPAFLEAFYDILDGPIGMAHRFTYIHSISSRGDFASMAFRKSLNIVSIHGVPEILKNIPRRASWQAHIHGDYRVIRPQSRIPQSWLTGLVLQAISCSAFSVHTGLSDGLLRESLNHDWLVALGIEELVVYELDRRIISG